ncbi:hypothetical protein [Geodermatophilus sp. URMC 64]
MDHVADLVGQLGQPRSRVLDIEERLREAEETWIVRGLGIAVTGVALMYQCAL